LPLIAQTLTLNGLLRSRTNAQVQFKSRLGTATSNQIARVEVSTDDGVTWTNLYVQAGSGTPNGESSFSTRSVSAGNYAGSAVRIRFNYDLRPGTFNAQTSPGYGWYLDDVAFSGFDQLGSPTNVADLSGTNFSFNAAQTGDYLLDVRAKVYGPYYLDFGPAKLVTVVDSPVVQITRLRPTSTNTLSIDFSVLASPTPNLQLLMADDFTGPWNQDTAATILTITPGSAYRAITSSTVPRRYYRIRAL